MESEYFGLHTDLNPSEIAAVLRGEIAWQRTDALDWAALLRFNRAVEASLPRAPHPGQSGRETPIIRLK